MKMLLRGALMVAAIGGGFCPAVSGAEVAGYSDLAQIALNAFLVVNDRKSAAEEGDRLGVVTVTARDGVLFQPVPVDGWTKAADAPSDLEVCCVVPGDELTVLAGESGVWNGNFGRVFHLGLGRDADGGWRANVRGEIDLYRTGPHARPLSRRQRVFAGDQVEGIACFRALGKLWVAYGERGGAVGEDDARRQKTGTIVWGTLDLASHRFVPQGEAPLVATSVLGDRDCSALYIVPAGVDGTSFAVWSVATLDAGGNNGPFESVVFLAGRLAVNTAGDNLAYVAVPAEKQQRRVVAGLKIEGLAGPAANAPGSAFTFATDDENFGGVVRPL